MRRVLYIFLLLNLLIIESALAQAAATPESSADWLQIPVNGAGLGAVCACGMPYSFFVHSGNPDKLMVYFQGGGACWNADTCKEGGPFDDSVEPYELDRYEGIFNFANVDNPVADFSIVVVAYCTGDVHTGSATQTFSDGGKDFTIKFNGFTNVQAVLDWTFAHYEHPTRLVVTGSSAGAYGAVFNAPYILSHYPDAKAVVFGDAGIGVMAAGWDGLSAWGTAQNRFDSAAYQSITPESNLTNSLYRAAAQTFTQASIAEYTSFGDAVQTGFYKLQGGNPDDWAGRMQSHLADLDMLANFHSYIGWGGLHTILPTPLFYLMQVNGVPFRDWFADLVAGSTVENVQCKNCQAVEVAPSS
jgi:Pectinacetylesterase